MMDRNLGQLEIDPSLKYSVNTSTSSANAELIMPGQNSLLYYQFGRKDPFPAHSMKIARDIDDNLPITNLNYTTTLPGKPAGDYYSSTNVEWETIAVSSPTKFIAGLYYLGDISANTHWGDSNYARGEAKSLYDPCPPGWKLPQSDVFEDFIYGRTLNKRSSWYGIQ